MKLVTVFLTILLIFPISKVVEANAASPLIVKYNPEIPLTIYKAAGVEWVVFYEGFSRENVENVHSYGMRVMAYVSALLEPTQGALWNGYELIYPKEDWLQYDGSRYIQGWYSPYSPFLEAVTIKRIECALEQGADGIFLDALCLRPYADKNPKYAIPVWKDKYASYSFQEFRHQSILDAAQKIYEALKKKAQELGKEATLMISDNNISMQKAEDEAFYREWYAEAIDKLQPYADGFVLEYIRFIEENYPNPIEEANAIIECWKREKYSYNVFKPLWIIAYTKLDYVYDYIREKSLELGFGYWPHEESIAPKVNVKTYGLGDQSATITYMQGGVTRIAKVNNSTPNWVGYIDRKTNINISEIIQISDGERYKGNATSIFISMSRNVTVRYWHQWKPKINLQGTTRSNPAKITMRMIEGKLTLNSTVYQAWSDWCDDSSTLTLSQATSMGWLTSDRVSWKVTSAFIATVAYNPITLPYAYLANNPLNRTYLIFNNYKYYIINPEAFTKYGFKWSDVLTDRQEEVDNTLAAPINFDYLLDGKMPLPNKPYIAGDVNDGSLYYLPYYGYKEWKWPITWEGYSNGYNGWLKSLPIRYDDPSLANPTNPNALNGVNPLPNVPVPSHKVGMNPLGRVYLIFNGYKYYFTNPEAYLGYGFKWSDIDPTVNPDAYPSAQINYDYLLDGKMPLPNKPYIVGDVNDGSLYWVPYYTWSGEKYSITSMEAFKSYGFTTDMIRFGDPGVNLPTSTYELDGNNPQPNLQQR
jgi:hypothetical protein